MAVVILNPNSTSSMTDAMIPIAQKAAPGLTFEGWTSDLGPPAIQGEADGKLATPPLLDLVRKAGRDGAEGIMIACFDDTALAEAATLAPCPVIGIGQASYHFAALRQWRFSVVTTLAVSAPILERNITDLGLARYLARVRASDVPVLELERAPDKAATRVLEEAHRACADDEIDAIVLGCAGMGQVIDHVRQSLDIPVLDPVACAARCLAALRSET